MMSHIAVVCETSIYLEYVLKMVYTIIVKYKLPYGLVLWRTVRNYKNLNSLVLKYIFTINMQKYLYL